MAQIFYGPNSKNLVNLKGIPPRKWIDLPSLRKKDLELKAQFLFLEEVPQK